MINNWWTGIAADNSFQYIAASSWYGVIYTSSDRGISWNLTSAPNAIWTDIASDWTGRYLVAVQPAGGQIYVSTSYGLFWNVTTAPSSNWKGIASSSSGSILVAGAPGDGIYVSDMYIPTQTPTKEPSIAPSPAPSLAPSLAPPNFLDRLSSLLTLVIPICVGSIILIFVLTISYYNIFKPTEVVVTTTFSSKQFTRTETENSNDHFRQSI